ncbi:protein containing cAMP-binding domain of CRP [Lentimicrobium saccharophilum]|uniref:Protein containing cAMP-binding domain of CRP n=1 Tax=Lentimicrobium saccharophilum TaxID=1678841 RepID=A0A0S7C0S8_9BACT|nr:Crp/Fnr family transcriptional regulator [Lentimicrobium saccharophilum]GAP42918.1 protein containing cAMP-binding domain of CRP [Lentimicrobium saccharophilum]
MANSVEANCTLCLQRSDIFRNLKDNELHSVNSCRVSIKYHQGEILFKQGSPCHDFVCITSGLVKLYLESESDKRIIIGFAKPVDYIFVPGAFTDKRHHFTAIACEETTACLVSADVFQQIIENNNSFSSSFLNKISEQAIRMFDQLSSLTHKQMPGRIADVLLCLSQRIYNANPFVTSLSRQDIADMSGMTKESAIRIMKTFKDDNLIRTEGDLIELLNIPMLETISRNG